MIRTWSGCECNRLSSLTTLICSLVRVSGGVHICSGERDCIACVRKSLSGCVGSLFIMSCADIFHVVVACVLSCVMNGRSM